MKHKILYVEDNLVFRNQVQKRLEAQGWEVIVASDGKEAMDKFQAEQGNFEVAVLDVELPGGYNGWQVAEYITKRNSVVSLIFFSSHHEVADYERGYDHGARRYLPKVQDVDDLIVWVRNCLREDNGCMCNLGNGIVYDTEKRALYAGGKWEVLGDVDGKILSILCQNQNQIVDMNWMIESVWGSANLSKEMQIRKSVFYLREFLKKTLVEIRTEHNKGYRLVKLQENS